MTSQQQSSGSAIMSMLNRPEEEKATTFLLQNIIEQPSVSSGTWLQDHSVSPTTDSEPTTSANSLSRRIQSEREVSEITHDNTLLEQSTWESECISHHRFSNSMEKPMLVKEITETVEIDKTSTGGEDGFDKSSFESRQSTSTGVRKFNDCDHTRVTMIRDVVTNIHGLGEYSMTRDEEHKRWSSERASSLPRVDLETLYIVECGKKEPAVADQKVYRKVKQDEWEDEPSTPFAERIKLDDLLRINNRLTKGGATTSDHYSIRTITEEEITVRYELHEYHNMASLMMHIAEMSPKVRSDMAQVQRNTLTKYESREPYHLDVIVGDEMSNFILPHSQRNGAEESESDKTMVSVNYINSADGSLIGCERRAFTSLSVPVREALREPKAQVGPNRYLSIVVVSKDTTTGKQDLAADSVDETTLERQHRKPVSSHLVLERHLPLLTKLREGADLDMNGQKPADRQRSSIWVGGRYQPVFSKPQVQRQDEAIQVKPLVCDESTLSSLRGSLNQYRIPTVNQRDATTSPVHFGDESPAETLNIDDEYAAEIYCTSLDFKTNKQHIPGLARVPISIQESVSTQSETSSLSSQVTGSLMECENSIIPIKIERRDTQAQKPLQSRSELRGENSVYNGGSRRTSEKPPHRIIKPTPQSYPIYISRNTGPGAARKTTPIIYKKPPGTSRSKPLIVNSKDELVNVTLEELRKSIRQHAHDTCRVEMDTRKRSNSWSAPFNGRRGGAAERTLRKSQERHVRAKLIPVWNSTTTREYFARVEDYINEHAARCIKRSYSTSYLDPGPKSRVRWIRIPGETIRVEERRTIEMRRSARKAGEQRAGMITAECRELPYELRYWNILHLLNQERVTGKQLGNVFPYPLEEWVMSNDCQNGIKQTAQEILSPSRNVRSSQDSALLWFLTYDENAEKTTQKYLQTLMREGRPIDYKVRQMIKDRMEKQQLSLPAEQSSYKRVEKVVRYEKLPDRMVLVGEDNRPTQNVAIAAADQSSTKQQYVAPRQQQPYAASIRGGGPQVVVRRPPLNQYIRCDRPRPPFGPYAVIPPNYRTYTPQMYINQFAVRQRYQRHPVVKAVRMPAIVTPVLPKPPSVPRNVERNWC